MNPLLQFDSPRVFENADGSKVQASTLLKLGDGLVASRTPANAAPGEPSYAVLQAVAAPPSSSTPRGALAYVKATEQGPEISLSSGETVNLTIAIEPLLGGTLVVSTTLLGALGSPATAVIRVRIDGGAEDGDIVYHDEVLQAFTLEGLHAVPITVIVPCLVEPGVEYTVSVTAEVVEGEAFYQMQQGSTLILEERPAPSP